jgi:hypothetical protein
MDADAPPPLQGRASHGGALAPAAGPTTRGRFPAVRRAAVLIVLVLAGCGGDDPAQPETRTTPPSQTPVASSGGVCARYVPTDPVPVPKGLILPEGEVIAGKVTRVPPQVRVEGFIRSQPAAVRNFFLSSEDVKVTFSEDEGFEAEALITDGRFQNFWKVSKACDGGSLFAAIVVREKKGAAKR